MTNNKWLLRMYVFNCVIIFSGNIIINILHLKQLFCILDFSIITGLVIDSFSAIIVFIYRIQGKNQSGLSGIAWMLYIVGSFSCLQIINIKIIDYDYFNLSFSKIIQYITIIIYHCLCTILIPSLAIQIRRFLKSKDN